MARLPRYVLPDGVFHVVARGVEKRPIYLDDEDYVFFLRLLLGAGRSLRWTFHALCLMRNHYHLVLETSVARLSEGMHRLNGRYAEEFNRRHERVGHLFGDRFAAYPIEDEQYLADACRYVILNPVRAGLCATAGQWRWSGSRYGLDV